MSLARTFAHHWRNVTGQKAAAQRAAQDAFAVACAGLGAGDLAIDLGANRGIFTQKLAETGADVVAFEPDPHAFAALRAAVGESGNVTCLNAAAAAKAGTMTLYRTADFDRDPDRHSTSSSLVAEKRNVTAEAGISVEVVDFVAFLEGRDRDVAVIKMDIEGAEVDLMEALLDHPVAARITQIFVETHERAIPSLADRTAALKARTKGRTRPAVNWDWH
ncbi:FkbM family methyltransferase [Yoonia sp. R2331]|uniref:FkbM family methyltransferase n=1 Tax=Yoonia sp. R2331 TaxID=3237238 RepID=UPI0034E4DEB9